MRLHRGFTLIEILVTLVIVGILSGMVVLSFSQSPVQTLRHEANRLIRLIEAAGEEAVVQGQELALSFDSDRYLLLKFDVEEKAWQPFKDKTYGEYQLPENIELHYQQEGGSLAQVKEDRIEQFRRQTQTNDYVPMLLLLSSGESSSFNITFLHHNSNQTISLQGDGLGTLELYD